MFLCLFCFFLFYRLCVFTDKRCLCSVSAEKETAVGEGNAKETQVWNGRGVRKEEPVA